MGAALGRFMPPAGYAAIREECIAALASGAWDKLELGIRTADGLQVPAQGGGMILDGVDLAPDEIEVQVAGIPYPLYAKLFPAHVSAYESRK